MMNIFGSFSIVESYAFSMVIFSVVVLLFLLISLIQNKIKRYDILGSLLLWINYVLLFVFFTTESETKLKLFYVIIPSLLIYIYLLYKKKANFLSSFKRFVIILFICTVIFFVREILDNY